MRLLLAGGGTGGHVFPALAIARAVKAQEPDSEILFVGTRRGIEARIIPQTEFPVRFINTRGIRGTGLLNKVRAFAELPLAVLQSVSIVREFMPDCVLGVGGYASGPTVIAATLMGLPTAIQEQNSVMGTTNRILCRFVDRVYTAWENTQPAPAKEKTLFTGNPIRTDLLEGPCESKQPGPFNVLVFGGSAGARNINESIAANVETLTHVAGGIRILHQTGQGAAEAMKQAYVAAGIEADVREFINDMGPAYCWADLVVCRSGASTLAELTALGKPAIVVPYPYAIGDHQALNAKELAQAGAVRVVRDDKLKNGVLMKEILALTENREALAAMAENSRRLGRPQAARAIALDMADLIRSPH